MQEENLTNSFYSHSVEEEITPRDFYLWAAAHSRLCEAYCVENDVNLRKELNEKLDASLLQGKILLSSLHVHPQNSKPLIPASGINRFNVPSSNRFNQPKELLASKEIVQNKIHYPFKAELGTSPNLRAMPMPSRTYLKKKTQTN